MSQSVTAIEPDPAAAQRATDRLSSCPNAIVVNTDFQRYYRYLLRWRNR